MAVSIQTLFVPSTPAPMIPLDKFARAANHALVDQSGVINGDIALVAIDDLSHNYQHIQKLLQCYSPYIQSAPLVTISGDRRDVDG